MNVKNIRKKLSDHNNFYSAEEGERLRKQLMILSEGYVPKHTQEEYWAFTKHCMSLGGIHITTNGYQCTNHPYVYTFFSVPSQHVMGDCLEECLDNAINAANIRETEENE